MPKASTARARLPRGTKPVIQAFFSTRWKPFRTLRARRSRRRRTPASGTPSRRSEGRRAGGTGTREITLAPGSARPVRRSRPETGRGRTQAGNEHAETRVEVGAGRWSCKAARKNDRKGAGQ